MKKQMTAWQRFALWLHLYVTDRAMIAVQFAAVLGSVALLASFGLLQLTLGLIVVVGLGYAAFLHLSD